MLLTVTLSSIDRHQPPPFILYSFFTSYCSCSLLLLCLFASFPLSLSFLRRRSVTLQPESYSVVVFYCRFSRLFLFPFPFLILLLFHLVDYSSSCCRLLTHPVLVLIFCIALACAYCTLTPAHNTLDIQTPHIQYILRLAEHNHTANTRQMDTK